MVYIKRCIVPQCTNTSLKTPQKQFISVPKKANIRKKWLELAGRNPKDIALNSSVFFCEDHFNMEQDIINFNKYKMGFSERLLINDGVLPSKFGCQQDHSKRLCDASTSRGAFRQKFIQECIDETLLESTTGTDNQVDHNELEETITSKSIGKSFSIMRRILEGVHNNCVKEMKPLNQKLKMMLWEAQLKPWMSVFRKYLEDDILSE